MSILVKEVSKLYGSQKALDNISFEVGEGEVVGLLGPNGAGKSTIMKIITCFIPPSSGSVSVNGFDVLGQSIDVRKIIGYLPENNPLYHEMYVKEYLEFIADLHKLDSISKSRVVEMIETTGLGDEQNKKIGALSKGYKQRLGLAQALIHDPQVLILDEPTSGLDPNQLSDIRNLIKEIGKKKTIIFSTHIMQEVEAVCDRIIIIDKGKIVADDSTKNISKMSAGNEIISVEFNSNVLAEELMNLPGTIEIKEDGDRKWIITAHAESDCRSKIFRFAVQKNITVLSLQKEERSLEEIFQSLTKK
ncbi:MAG: gliding motility-associated ABC transporter ATP-binding subunit GldA [Bacteroidales bacterium]|nr:gliding motility-associated ABC transporter ATP-binding subunit GldA [Bacteroidales bacterium]